MSARNTIATVFTTQDPETGIFSMAGPPFTSLRSDTYHAWTLIGACTYILISVQFTVLN
jgi:hypothetical protein